MVIGLCGKACSGKNEVVSYLETKNYFVIDADKIGINALVDEKEKLIESFGTSILDNDGLINRKKLGNIVFSSKIELEKLNAISGTYIVKKIKDEIVKNYTKKIVINAALLPNWQIDEIDYLVWVESNLFIRLKRSLKRDKRGLVFAIKRVVSQRKLSVKNFFKMVDTYYIRNNFSKVHLKKECEKLYIWLEDRAKH